MAGQKTSALLYRRWCSQPTLALSQPAPRPTRGAARVPARPSQPRGYSRALGPQRLTSHSQSAAAPAPIRRRGPGPGRGSASCGRPSFLEPRESFLGDAVTKLPPPKASLSAREERRNPGCGLGPTAALEVTGQT